MSEGAEGEHDWSKEIRGPRHKGREKPLGSEIPRKGPLPAQHPKHYSEVPPVLPPSQKPNIGK